MVDAFCGRKYKLESSENFDEFMKAHGVSFVTRKLGNVATPIVELKKDGDYYIWTSNSSFKNLVTRFIPGEEFDETTPDGRKVRSTIVIEGNTLKETQVDPSGLVTTAERTFTEDQMTLVCQVGDIVCTRIYKYIE